MYKETIDSQLSSLCVKIIYQQTKHNPLRQFMDSIFSVFENLSLYMSFANKMNQSHSIFAQLLCFCFCFLLNCNQRLSPFSAQSRLNIADWIIGSLNHFTIHIWNFSMTHCSRPNSSVKNLLYIYKTTMTTTICIKTSMKYLSRFN